MNHWKERNPEETIRIIKNFFKEKNFIIKKTSNTQVNGNYWCHVELWSPDEKLLLAKANGKGINESFCEASAYGELYERYCGYSPDIIAEDPSKLDYNFLDYIYTAIFVKNNNQFLVSDFRNIRDIKDQKYISREALTFIFGSTGLSCGNSLQEAVLQGSCELCERYVITKVLTTDGPFGYLIKTGENKELGLKFEYFDLSFDFNMPVIALRILDTKNYGIGHVFGCHPVKEIAMERCMTEFTQGGNIYMDQLNMSNSRLLPINYSIENCDDRDNLITFFSTGNGYIPFDKFRIEKIDKESGAFIENPEKVTNEELLQFLLNTVDANIYVANTSQCKDMFAVHVFSPELQIEDQNSFVLPEEDLEYFKAEMEYNALLKDSIKEGNMNKTMNMIKDALLVNNIPVYPIFYKQCHFNFQIEKYLVALFALYVKDIDLYNDAMSKIQIMDKALCELNSINFEDNVDFNYWFSYLL